MTTPDTTQTAQQREAELDQELVDALGDELDRQAGGHVSRTAINERAEALFNAIGAQLAAIRRQAAADALNEAARSLRIEAKRKHAVAKRYETELRPGSAEVARIAAGEDDSIARRIEVAAADKIAEGYEYECQECDTPVPDAGDLCEQHDVDDEDPRWAE